MILTGSSQVPKPSNKPTGEPRKMSFNLRPSWTFEDPGFQGHHARTIASCYLMRWMPPREGLVVWWWQLKQFLCLCLGKWSNLSEVVWCFCFFVKENAATFFLGKRMTKRGPRWWFGWLFNNQPNFWRKGFVAKGLDTSKNKFYRQPPWPNWNQNLVT